MIANPTPLTARQAQGFLNDPVVGKLDPATVASLRDIVARGIHAQPTDDAAVKAALQEATAKGWQPDKSGWWKALLITAGFAAGGLGLAAASGGLGASAAGAGTAASSTAPTAATIAASADPAAAGAAALGPGALGTGSVVGPAAAGGGSTFGQALLGLTGGKAGAVSAGLNLASAALGSNAAKTASQQQIDAANKAIAANTAAYAPYQQIGAQGLAGLGNLKPFEPPAKVSVADTRAGIQAPAAPPQGMGLGSLGQPQGGIQPRGQPTGGMVTLRAPDGSTRSVPQQSAQALVQSSNGQLQVVQ